MRLKRLELYGFKSFAEKTTLQFNDDFVAVVGPNGSGKSNLSDAVRWVLGEQSAKALRGSRMEDVIFNGTDKKAPMNLAQVVLIFDNADGQIPLPYEEVSVARKVYRNGEGEYFINNQQVRRKDINELFLDTGVGKEGYSIIGQGRIDEILSTRSEDRRSIFEEAAGIAKFKYKKTESLQRLDRTERQLDEVTRDLDLKEQEARLLKRQADNAKRGRRLMGELEQHELSLLKRQQEVTREALTKINADLDLNTAETEALKNELTALAEKARPYETFLHAYESKRQTLLEAVSKLERDLQKEETQHSVAVEKIQFYEQDLARLDAEEKAAEEQERAISAQIDTIGQEKARLEQTLKEISDQADHLVEEMGAADPAIAQKTQEAEAELRRLREALSVLAYRREEAKKAQQQLQHEKDEKTALAKTLAEEHNALTEKRDAKEKALEEQLHEQEARHKARAACEEEMRRLTEITDRLTEEKRKNDAKRAGALTQEKMLRALMQQYEGYQRSVQNLLRSADQDPSIKKHLIGPLADLIRVEPGYETAVEVALGGALQNVVVESEQDAKVLIQLLKERHLGRVTFLPIDRIRGSQPVLSDAPEALCNGVDAVRYDDDIDAIVTHFLARTTFVRTIDDALRLSHRGNEHNRLISLEGDVLNTWGSMVGGTVHRRNEASLLNRDRELEALQKTIAACEASDKENALALQKAQEERREQMAERDRLSGCLEEDQALERKLRAELEQLRLAVMEKQREQEEAAAVLSREDAFVADAFVKQEAELKARETEALSAFNTWKEQEQEQLKLRQGKEKEAALLENKKEYYKKDLEQCSRRLEEQQTQLRTLQQQKQFRSEQKQEAERVVENSRVLMREGEAHRLQWKAEWEEKRRAMDALTEDHRMQHEKADQIVQQQAQKNERLQELQNAAYRLQVEKEQKEQQEQQRLEDYRAQYDLSAEMVAERLRTLVPVETTRQQVLELKEKLSKIGYFNVETIEQYQAIAEELDFLKQQMEDLKKSRQDIEDLIRELDATMEEMFTDSFRRMNEEYNRIFQILFRGGQAHLRLDGTDVLTAGVEIEAQPPGKKLQSLNLLSGGERSMTALALLFAIFSIHPTPFCILDEIDASLDEANIGRYVDYLQSICNETQFIVITHRKSTMQLAETLYGVTMQEGLSHVVSLRFKDFEDEADQAMRKDV